MVGMQRGCGTPVFGDNCVFDESFLFALSPICQEIKNSKNLIIDKKANIDEKLLATLIRDLRKHYHAFYGLTAEKPRPFCIPHSKLFEDFSANGSLYVILATLLESATIRELLPFESIFANEKSQILSLLRDIDKNLAVEGFNFSPLIFLNKVPVSMVNKLRRIVVLHGGRLVSSERNATHVVDWNEDMDQAYRIPTEDEVTARLVTGSSIFNVQDHAVVHWINFPDSYNELVQQQVCEGANEPTFEFSQKQRYYISCRYLFDCESFNEWGNETDYELVVDEDESNTQHGADTTATPIARGRGRGKKRLTGSNTLVNIQSKIMKETFIPQMLLTSEKLFTDVLPLSLLPNLSDSILGLEIDGTEKHALKPMIECVPSAEGPSEDLEVINAKQTGRKRKFEDDITAARTPPSWFSMESISANEKKYLGHIILDLQNFENSTTSENNYIQTRNSIVNLYLLNKHQYLTATECRRKISGDISKIIRIHEFLDAFKIINYEVKLESCPRTLMDDFYQICLKRQFLHRNLVSEFPSFSLFSNGLTTSGDDSMSWTSAMDEVLLSSVVTYKMDWKQISSNIQNVLMKQLNEKCDDLSGNYELQKVLLAITPYHCMIRFIEMNIRPPPLSDSLKSIEQTSVGLSVDDQTISKGSQPGKQAVLYKVKHILQLIRSLEKLFMEVKSQNSIDLNISAGNSEVLDSILMKLKVDFSETANEIMNRIEQSNINFVNEYLVNRMEHVESRLERFRHIETQLQNEVERIDIEKRELLIQKYYNPVTTINASTVAPNANTNGNSQTSLPYNSSFASLPSNLR